MQQGARPGVETSDQEQPTLKQVVTLSGCEIAPAGFAPPANLWKRQAPKKPGPGFTFQIRNSAERGIQSNPTDSDKQAGCNPVDLKLLAGAGATSTKKR